VRLNDPSNSRGRGIPSVRRSLWLDEKDMGFFFGDGAVFDPLRNYEHELANDPAI
jgi:hypothetical protein